ncbi:hypothetical protein [Brachybacterium sp. Z12]|uniref:hypothetical protein n=1 Tax=Brachybacterium sp. Z12 TaxID=2759167 RepID=UPI00223BAD0D|nr:hypothetical protein [Brachybacterium sp. Z12]
MTADGLSGEPVAGAAGSLALRDIPIPDYCDVVIVPTAGVDEQDPRVWADAIFSHENTPLTSRGCVRCATRRSACSTWCRPREGVRRGRGARLRGADHR